MYLLKAGMKAGIMAALLLIPSWLIYVQPFNVLNSSKRSMGFAKQQMIEQMEVERNNLERALDDIEANGGRYQWYVEKRYNTISKLLTGLLYSPGTHLNRKVCTKECFATSCFDWCLEHSHPSVEQTDGPASVEVFVTTRDARGQLVTRTETNERRVCGHQEARYSPGDCVIVTSSFHLGDDEEGVVISPVSQL